MDASSFHGSNTVAPGTALVLHIAGDEINPLLDRRCSDHGIDDWQRVSGRPLA
jgi:hypothetical protein